MSLIEETYVTFMMDHAAGQHSPAMALAADLHALLSDKGSATNDVWVNVAVEIKKTSEGQEKPERLNLACDVIACSYDSIKWRRGISGAHYAKSAVAGGKYMRLLPGKSVPRHGHGKLEVTVVLEGELSDGVGGIYQKGDIAFGIPGQRHKPAAHGDRPCICFVAKV